MPQRFPTFNHDAIGFLMEHFQLRGHVAVVSSTPIGEKTSVDLDSSATIPLVENKAVFLQEAIWAERGSQLAALDLDANFILASGYPSLHGMEEG